MKLLFYPFLTFLLLLASTYSLAQKVTDQDFETVLGDDWKGTLTYVDYQSGKKVGIPVELKVSQMKEGQYLLEYSFPEEPQANSQSKIKLSKDGKRLDKYRVLSREDLEGNTVKVVCLGDGKDDGKKATLFYTYTFDRKEFVIRKDVQYSLGNQAPFFRNEFRFTR
ncbi:MAG: hypothetical protein AAFS00_03405 [Bacteroidota bacterium]